MALKKLRSKKTDVRQDFNFEIYEAINTPIVVFDGKSQLPIYCNSAFEEISGYVSKSVEKMDLLAFFARNDLERAKGLRDILFSISGEITELDLSFRKKSGRKLSVNVFAKTVNQTKTKSILVMAVHDITAIKKLQKEKETVRKEMTHVSKLADIGRLAAGVAHELNNPLMIIQGFAENIDQMMDSDKIDQNELKWQLNPILKATQRMSRIIQQLTRLSRDDGEISLVIANLAEVVEDGIHLIKNQLSYNDIEVEKNYDKNALVKCDPTQIEQIILNILNNAIHALTQVEGARKLVVKIETIEDLTTLSIHNNGPAIPRDIKDKVMTPFFTTKEVGEGTGLGLSVSYGIMRAHGGDLNFSSKKDQGTAFNLVFPKVMGNSTYTTNLEGIGLVVDDDDFAREIISNKLMRYGFKIYQASNGKEALEIMRSTNDIEFIFTDAKMPVMDGASLVKEIRKFDKSCLIFAITGFTGISSIEKELSKHGINGFLAKPLDHDKFTECIKQIEEKLNRKEAAA